MSNQLVPEHQHPQRSDDLFTESLSPNDGNKTPNAVNQAASRDVISVIIKRELKCADDPQKKNRATKTSARGRSRLHFQQTKKKYKTKEPNVISSNIRRGFNSRLSRAGFNSPSPLCRLYCAVMNIYRRKCRLWKQNDKNNGSILMFWLLSLQH